MFDKDTRTEPESGVPAVSAVILLGGYSTRMNRDKSTLEYSDGSSAAGKAARLAGQVCDDVYLSIRPGQGVPADVANLPVLEDRFVGIGPIGGILTALYKHPGRAWLVLSCDMPLLEVTDLRLLLHARNPGKIATALAVTNIRKFEGEESLLPEPLCAIWEPRSRGRILPFIQEGAFSPRRVLQNCGVHMVRPENADATFNANTPEEWDIARCILLRRYGPTEPDGSNEKNRETAQSQIVF